MPLFQSERGEMYGMCRVTCDMGFVETRTGAAYTRNCESILISNYIAIFYEVIVTTITTLDIKN